MAAALAAEPDVHPHPQNLPLLCSAGMGLFQFHNVVQAQVHALTPGSAQISFLPIMAHPVQLRKGFLSILAQVRRVVSGALAQIEIIARQEGVQENAGDGGDGKAGEGQ